LFILSIFAGLSAKTKNFALGMSNKKTGRN